MGRNTTLTLCLFQSVAGLLFGWEQSVISGLMLMPDFQARFGVCSAAGVCVIPSSRQSVIVGLFSVGALIGALGGGFIASRIGLRTTNLISLVVFLAGVAVETSANTQWAQIVVARLLTGYGVGTLCGLVPAYQAEAAPPSLRGVITGSFQAMCTLGIFLANVVNDGMKGYAGSVSWRIPVALELVWSMALLVGFALSPESPSYYAKRGKYDECRHAIARLRGCDDDDAEVEEALEIVKLKQAQEESLGDASYAELFSMKDRNLFRTLIGCVLQVGQQTTGINFFFSYGTQFFQASGISDPFITQIILSAVNLAMSFPGMWIVYRFGRRQVLLYGAVVEFIGQIVTGAVGVALPGQVVSGRVLIAFSCIFIAGFATTWGPVPWVVCAETFPTRLASRATTLAVGSNWAMNTIIAFVVPYVTDAIGASITFVWAGFIAASFFFVYFCVPETKGLSITQIDELFHARIPAWRSSGWTSKEIDIENETKATHAHREGGNGAGVNRFADMPDVLNADGKKLSSAAETEKFEATNIPDSGVATPATNAARTPEERSMV